MAIYSYIVTHDTGFSPNPFWGYGTLACCKPVIRRTARVGDWVVGLTPKSRGNRMVYAMEVTEVLGYDRYFDDARFQAKKPVFDTEGVAGKCGDNIYKPGSGGSYIQLRSMHSKGKGEEQDSATKAHDLKGRNALVARRFWYFGSQAIKLPKRLQMLVTGRGHRKVEIASVIATFQAFIKQYEEGVAAPPCSPASLIASNSPIREPTAMGNGGFRCGCSPKAEKHL